MSPVQFDYKNATRQSIFDTVAKHLLTQKCKSQIPNGSMCSYRGDKGRMCAVGALIPDEIYKPEFESNGVHRLIDKHSHNMPEDFAKFLSQNENLLEELQSIHDLWQPDDNEELHYSIAYIKNGLKNIAARFGGIEYKEELYV